MYPRTIEPERIEPVQEDEQRLRQDDGVEQQLREFPAFARQPASVDLLFRRPRLEAFRRISNVFTKRGRIAAILVRSTDTDANRLKG